MSSPLSFSASSTPFSASSPPSPQQPSKLQEQRKQVLDQASLVAANNELLLQAIIAKQLNVLASQAYIEPHKLDCFSRAIDIKPGLRHMDGSFPPPPPPPVASH